MQPSNIPEPVFLNVEFIFSWLTGTFGNIFSLQFLSLLQFIAGLLIVAMITLILYCLVRIHEMKQEDKKAAAKARVVEQSSPDAHVGGSILDNLPGTQPKPKNETWEHIRSKLLSDSPSDWRLAIIEADIYMDRLLDTKGYRGDTIGDKLKNLEGSNNLPSLQIAWEAHKVRNRIAHDGAAFVLTMPEARRVLSYYEIVFRDLDAIE